MGGSRTRDFDTLLRTAQQFKTYELFTYFPFSSFRAESARGELKPRITRQTTVQGKWRQLSHHLLRRSPGGRAGTAHMRRLASSARLRGRRASPRPTPAAAAAVLTAGAGASGECERLSPAGGGCAVLHAGSSLLLPSPSPPHHPSAAGHRVSAASLV